MPGFDRTGPGGQGSMTGRKNGKCNPDNREKINQEDFENEPRGLGRRFARVLGKGLGMGLAMRQGRGRGAGRRGC